jgi:hypothetical protein
VINDKDFQARLFNPIKDPRKAAPYKVMVVDDGLKMKKKLAQVLKESMYTDSKQAKEA